MKHVLSLFTIFFFRIDANSFKITWAEKFDEINDRCRAKNLNHKDQEELKLVRKANMMVINSCYLFSTRTN